MTNLLHPQECVAAYALDILEEQAEFERELAASETLRSDSAALGEVVSNLAYGVVPVPLPTSFKSKLFDRLDRIQTQPADLLELLTWPISDLQKVALDLNNWEPIPITSKAERVVWLVNQMPAQVAFFLRISTGGMIPRHRHAIGESTLVLAGRFINDDGQIYEAGDLFVIAANTSHQPSTSPGCLILCITCDDPFGIR
jgi:hypothetical protein